jgi:hypothetical protein
MRKLAWLAFFIFLALFTIAILGAINYAGIGDAIGGFTQNTLVLPVRNFFVDGWNFIGQSGWYIAVAVLAISAFGAVFWVPIAYNIFIKKGIQEKLLHRTGATSAPYQNQPSATLPVSGLQSTPTTSNNPLVQPEKTESET